MKLRLAFAAAALIAAAGATALTAQAVQRVSFARGNDNASVTGSIKGRQYKDYLLGARAGQTMAVSLITRGSAYFNILPPGSDSVAIYNSSTSGQDATGVTLPRTGDYRIRVYLMGAAMRSTRPVSYQLSMTVMN